MSLSYLFDPNLQIQDKSGKNNVNGFLRVYIDGTDDRAVTYKDFNGTFNQADIRLDNNGRAVVIVDDTMTYRLEVYDRDGAMLWTQYPVKPSNTVINYGINNTYVMNADVRGTPDEIDVSQTTDPQTGFKTFFVKLSSTVNNFFDVVTNTLTNHGDTIGNLQTTVSNQGTAIGILQNGKKDKQDAVTFNGSATKTVKKVTQNADGEITVEFEDIDIPPEVPNVEITSPNGTIDVQSSTDAQTNTKTFEIDINNGKMQHWLGGYGPTYTPFPGDNRGHTLGISKWGLKNNEIDYVGDFIDRIETCPYPDGVEDGYIYLKPGLYYIDCIIRYQQDSEDLSNTLDEVLVYTGYGNANESIAYQLDSSGPEATENRHNLRVSFVRHVTSTEGNLLYFSPSSRVDWTDAYIQKLQIVKLDGIRGEKGEQGPQGPAGQDGQDGPTYTAGNGIKIENDVISTDIAIQNAQKIDVFLDFGNVIQTVNSISTDGSTIRTDGFNFTLPSIKAGDGIKFTKVGNETTVSMDSEVSDVVETVEKLKQDLDTQITTNFDMPNISQVYDFADPSVSTLANGACMLCQSFTIPINHELRTTTDDPDTPTLLGIYAQQNFAHKIMLALYEYTYAGEGEEHGSSTYVGDTGPVDVVQGVNEYPLKNRNPSITELRSDKVYYATIYLPNAARVNGLLLAGAPNYGNGSIPAEPRLTCAVENITWNGQELDMSDPTTTLNHYQEVVIPGEPTYYQYYIGPWNSGYNERQTAPRFYMQIRNGEYNVPVVPTAPFVDLGDALPRGTLTQTDIPSFTPSQENSAYRDVTPLMNVTITGFEWIDGMSAAAGWAAANCVFDSGFSTNLSGVSNTVTELGQVVSGEYPGYAHRITFTTPLTLTAGTTYRFLCGCTDGSPYFKVWLDPTDVIYFGNNGWYVDISNLTRDEHHAGMYNKLYDSNNNSYVI